MSTKRCWWSVLSVVFTLIAILSIANSIDGDFDFDKRVFGVAKAVLALAFAEAFRCSAAKETTDAD